jgi:hypothetical protein
MSDKALKLLTSGYLAVYFAGIVIGLVQHDISISKTDDLLVILVFFFFTAGYITSWLNETAGGIVMQLWHLAIWILGLFVWSDSGIILLGFPVLIFGVLLNLSAYNKSAGGKRPDKEQWKFAFRLLLVNYTVLYFVIILSDLLTKNLPDLMSWPFIIFPVLLIIYITGSILSWINAMVSGILFIIWYLTIVTLTILSPDFSSNGPYALMGFPLLLQGMLYIKQKINRL